jgi:hypothetical protein
MEGIRFERFIYLDSATTKKGAPRTVTPQLNVIHHTYTMPTNVSLDKLLVVNDVTNKEQILASIKALMCAKVINARIASIVGENNKCVFCIENYIMPGLGGKNQLQVVGALINLQGYVREAIIRMAITNPDIRMIVASPSTIKKYFCRKGNASKEEMINSFFNTWYGRDHIENKGKIDDIVDSYALMQYASSRIRYGNDTRDCDFVVI